MDSVSYPFLCVSELFSVAWIFDNRCSERCGYMKMVIGLTEGRSGETISSANPDSQMGN